MSSVPTPQDRSSAGSGSRETRFSWKAYTGVTIQVVVLTIVLHTLKPHVDLVNISLMYLFPVLFSAVYWGIRPAVYAAGSGVLAFDFFYVPPLLSFTVEDIGYLFTFIVFLAVAILTASLADRLKQQLRYAKQREAHTAALYALSKQLNVISDLPQLLENISRQVAVHVGAWVAIYLPDSDNELRVAAVSPSSANWGDGDSEMAIAKWVLRHGEVAGRGSGTLRESPGLYLPLRAEDRLYGVLAARLHDEDSAMPAETLLLLEAIGGLAAGAIARVKLSEEAKLAQVMADSERLRAALLDSVSHELRTPLATLIGSATSLIEDDALYSPADRMELLGTIREGALRMNRLVTNLLGMVKLESGMLKLRRSYVDLADIFGVVLKQVKEFQQHRLIRVELEERIPFLLGDDALLEQVFVNLVSNAIKYSPDGSTIVIRTQYTGHDVTITVADRGRGIPPEARDKVFDKFYRVDTVQRIPGIGLGLAICKGIVEAHGGTIAAEPQDPQGTIMVVKLPSENSDLTGLLQQDREDDGNDN